MDLKLRGRFGFLALKTLATKPSALPQSAVSNEASRTGGAAKLELYFGKQIWTRLANKVVLDFGCGEGREAIAVAVHGATCVWGIDIRDTSLEIARNDSMKVGVGEKCTFLNGMLQGAEVQKLFGTIEVAYALDSFEHFSEPEQILRQIYCLLQPGGLLYVSFGPPWKHPFGCHMFFFNSLPWMHFIFAEETIMAVRALYRQDGAKHFGEVEGGLNQMTVDRFVRITQSSGFQIADLHLIPIKGWNWLVRNDLTREYFTSVVQCVLKKPSMSDV